VLSGVQEMPLAVFVVWEPVLRTDLAPPTTSVLGLIHDPRALQYWDHDRVLSKDLVRTALTDPKRYSVTEDVSPNAVIWDTVALFPREAEWGKDVPVPVYYGHPVADRVRGLAEALRAQRDGGQR